VNPVLSRLFSKNKARSAPRSTGGRLIYAIGDVHGRIDLLGPLLEDIAADARRSAKDRAPRPVLIFLGDYVDRGPGSREVVETALALKRASDFEVRTLIGNHEETLLAFLDDPMVGASWVEYGGAQTLASYGVHPPSSRADVEAWEGARTAFATAFPADHLAFLRGLELHASYGDYVFVHAGVRPGVPFERQDPRDLLWIRQEFLDVDHGLGKVVVHGHTPEVEPYMGRHRIGIDTGAYATGVLTALKLQDEAVTVLQSHSGPPARRA
jgi:serine/threonine protein phosphatase 1